MNLNFYQRPCHAAVYVCVHGLNNSPNKFCIQRTIGPSVSPLSSKFEHIRLLELLDTQCFQQIPMPCFMFSCFGSAFQVLLWGFQQHYTSVFQSLIARSRTCTVLPCLSISRILSISLLTTSMTYGGKFLKMCCLVSVYFLNFSIFSHWWSLLL